MYQEQISDLEKKHAAELAELRQKLQASNDAANLLVEKATKFIKEHEDEICPEMMNNLDEAFHSFGIRVPGPKGGIRIHLEVYLNPDNGDETFSTEVLVKDTTYRTRTVYNLDGELSEHLEDLIIEAIKSNLAVDTEVKEKLGNIKIEIEESSVDFVED